MTTTTTIYYPLWMDLNGRVACADHIGAEASALLAAKPQRRSISTTMTVWRPVSAADHWYQWGCESCDRSWLPPRA